MIGIIITGHGGFATGLAKNVKMLSGVNVNAIDFTDDMTPEDLDGRIKNAIDECCGLKTIIIFTDIPGGTPYNRAVTISLGNSAVRVVAGTNVPMLLDATIKNLSGEEFDNNELVDILMKIGRDGINKFEMPSLEQDNDFGDEEGI